MFRSTGDIESDSDGESEALFHLGNQVQSRPQPQSDLQDSFLRCKGASLSSILDCKLLSTGSTPTTQSNQIHLVLVSLWWWWFHLIGVQK